MQLSKGLVAAAMVVSSLAVPASAMATGSLINLGGGSNDSLVNLNTGGSLLNVSPAICANVIASGDCSSSVKQSSNNQSSHDGGLVNVGTGGDGVNASPAVCANVIASGDCKASVHQTSTNQTGGSNNHAGNGLVNVNTGGSLVNASPAVCANV
ncbi:MAG TPA: hypothetical protein VK963_00645, partial [Candidatus Saccharimonadales bacterium]|nr:hypothetical protein [Candidatus Saccharimonadales bacterium]